MSKQKKSGFSRSESKREQNGSEGDGFFRPFSDLNLPSSQPDPPKPSPGKAGSAKAGSPKPTGKPESAKAGSGKPESAKIGSPKPTASRAASKPSASRPSASKPSASDPDEMLTFERLMSGVTPLDEAKARRIPTSGAGSSTDAEAARRARQARFVAEQEAEELARARLRSLVEDESRFEVVDDGRRIEGRRRGVDGSLVRRMRVGELAIDATLELQGLRVEQAREAVEEFVRSRRTKGDKVVVLIHGRGRSSPANLPVLRGEVAAWLSEGKASTHVAAFVTAPPEHGGEGAMYVLLANPSDDPRRV